MGGCDLETPFDDLYEQDPLLLLHLTDPCISRLDLSACALAEVPWQLRRLTELEGVDFSDNSIKVRAEQVHPNVDAGRSFCSAAASLCCDVKVIVPPALRPAPV